MVFLHSVTVAILSAQNISRRNKPFAPVGAAAQGVVKIGFAFALESGKTHQVGDFVNSEHGLDILCDQLRAFALFIQTQIMRRRVQVKRHVQTVAARLGLSIRAVYRLVAVGVFSPPVKVGGATRFYLSDLESYLASLRNARPVFEKRITG